MLLLFASMLLRRLPGVLAALHQGILLRRLGRTSGAAPPSAAVPESADQQDDEDHSGYEEKE